MVNGPVMLKDIYSSMPKLLTSAFTEFNKYAIRGIFDQVISDWENSNGISVEEASKWPFEKFNSECHIPLLKNFLKGLINEGYNADLAMKQYRELLKSFSIQ